MKAFIPIYLLGDLATFIYLMATDWNETSGFFSLLVCFVVNVFLAQIWPIYWVILHWLS
ncbi:MULTISPECIES: hypothetical protein [unclassified Pseudodesulfovibrio]|uniref:hypothetical protein n=1 Tax=unclassified Pseudodesulfovibrio TaxID=2661612 RepID=UPI0013E3A4AF|nr:MULTISPECIES: hypothetical protein [unclassified Pseudodesulfovibrio]MCJ2164364.1 hypothetical protein [Pseudodesulfovibrio sp. S3-i]